MNNNIIIAVFGFLWLTLSIAWIPISLYPLPFQRPEALKALAAQSATGQELIEENQGIKKKTSKEIEQMLIHELWKNWLECLLIIVAGIIAGYMLIKRRNLGRVLALSISGYLLFLTLINLLTLENWKASFSLKYYSMYFFFFPAQTIIGIINNWLSLATLIYFLMPSTTKTIKHLKAT